MLAELVLAAGRAGVGALTAAYVPTAKNAVVREHFDRLGFTRSAEHDDGRRDYRLDLAGFAAPSLPFGS